jgi:hypothetical protein
MGYTTSAVGDTTAAICDLYTDLPAAVGQDFLDALWEVIDNYRDRVEAAEPELARCPDCGRDGDASLMAAHRLTHRGVIRRVDPVTGAAIGEPISYQDQP